MFLSILILKAKECYLSFEILEITGIIDDSKIMEWKSIENTIFIFEFTII
jgi:hypothetical protein